MGVRQQRRRKQARVAQAVSVGGARRDPVHMRALGGGGAQLAAKTVGGNPLIVKRIRRDRLPVGSEQIDEAQRQESALPQTSFQRGRRRLRRNPLEEDRVG